MEKLLFALDVENDYPPVSNEGIWCKRISVSYKLVNAPFFIKGLALGDVFKAKKDIVNDHIFDFTIVKESGYSLVWMINLEVADIDQCLKSLRKIGCSTEGLQQFNLYSIDVPPTKDLSLFDEIINKAKQKGVALAYPVWRFKE